SPRLALHRREPLVEVNPHDARALGLAEGDLCKVATSRGSSLYRATLSEGQARGALFVPMHWTDITASPATGRTGKLASADTDPISGQPGFKDAAASIKRVEPVWRGFLVSRDALDISTRDYAVRSRVEGGWLYELAGLSDIAPTDLLPKGEVSEVSYPSKGMQRFAVCDNAGALSAALFLTKVGDLPQRDWVASQLGQSVQDPIALLAGRPRVAAADRGAIVCVCHDVGALEVEATIAEGAGTLDAIGAACRAGTNCGSCRPELARMLEAFEAEIKEAAE
ncbi:MAG: molybdopterin dinucleotide binding domain-containing protein, partial [Pseudomonadota bacterium]